LSEFKKIALVSGLGTEWDWEDKLHIALHDAGITFQHLAVPVDHDCLIFPGESKQETIKRYCTGNRTVIIFARKALPEDFPGAIIVPQHEAIGNLKGKLTELMSKRTAVQAA